MASLKKLELIKETEMTDQEVMWYCFGMIAAHTDTKEPSDYLSKRFDKLVRGVDWEEEVKMEQQESIPFLEWCKLLDEGKEIPKKYSDEKGDWIYFTDKEKVTYKGLISAIKEDEK